MKAKHVAGMLLLSLMVACGTKEGGQPKELPSGETSISEAESKGDAYKQGGRLIRVFTHDGKWVKNIVLDRRIAGLYVDEQANMLYGLDVNADEQIVKWKL